MFPENKGLTITGALAEYEPAMSFESIAARLGISRQGAYYLYIHGLAKLRRQGAKLESLQELAKHLDGERNKRCRIDCA